MKFERNTKIVFGASGATAAELADALSLIMEEVGTGAMVKVHVIAENNKPYADGDYSTTNVAAISGFLVQNKEII